MPPADSGGAEGAERAEGTEGTEGTVVRVDGPVDSRTADALSGAAGLDGVGARDVTVDLTGTARLVMSLARLRHTTIDPDEGRPPPEPSEPPAPPGSAEPQGPEPP